MSTISPRHRAAIVSLLFVFIIALAPGLRGHRFDTNCWRGWTDHILIHGLRNAYGSGTNYTPLFQYFMCLFGKMAGSQEVINNYISYIRVFPLLFDFWGLWIVWKWLNTEIDYLVILLVSMLNIAFSYDTVIWGQVDTIMSSLVFAALFALYRDKPVLSGVLMVLALNMKIQCLPFIPLWGLLLIEHFTRTGRWFRVLYLVGAIAATQSLILLPFAFGEGGLQRVWDTIVDIPNTAPFVTMNAANVWYWLIPNADADIDDVMGHVGSLSYLQVGLSLFCLSSLIAFIPLLSGIAKQISNKRGKINSRLNRELIWLTGALLPLLFFFFNTRMHERYGHPAFIFLTAYAFHKRRFGFLILMSVAYFLNVEWLMKWFALPNYGAFVFDPHVASALYALLIVGIYFSLYRLVKQKRLTEQMPSGLYLSGQAPQSL